jgi:hypothetical protein
MRFNKIKKEIHNQFHFERRCGIQQQAIDYCKKDQVFGVRGNQRHQGESTDLLKIRDQIKCGVTQRELLESYELN